MSPEKMIELFSPQDDFVLCNDRFTAYIGGIGSGKSFAGVAKALKVNYETRGLGLIVAPSYPMLRDATLRTFMQMADGAFELHRSEMRATIRGGGEILFRSADNPDSLRGPNLHWAFIDEAALCDEMAWNIVIGRLRADGKAGPCWITSTPKGRNWLYKQQDLMTVFRAKTHDNPHLDREFISSLEAAYTGSFARQELEGEFVSFEGLVYEEFNRRVHVTKRNPTEFVDYIAGVDEGYTNPAVIVVCGIDGDGRMHQLTEFYRRRVLQDDFVAEAQRLRNEYPISTFVVDPSAAGLIAAMRSARLAVTPARNAIFDGVQAVKSRLAIAGDGRPRLTIDPSCVNTAAEFESYAWKEGRSGVRDEPEKVNDHAMDALRYCVMNVDVAKAKMRQVANPFYS